MEYYTYAYLRKDGTPYYIGKGNGRRAYQKQKWHNPPKNKSRIIFLKQNLTEEEAFKHEIYMIAVFGRKDLETGILRNLTNGGEGTCGYKHSAEEIERRRGRKQKPRSAEYCKEVSERMKKMIRTEESNKKRSETMRGVKRRPRTEEEKRKISESVKGMKYKPRSEEHCKKISERMKGKNNPKYKHGKYCQEELE